jgi:FkbM family methyltransferase
MRYHPITLFGLPFLCDPDDSLDLTKWQIYEPFETSLIQNTVKGKVCLDIGAHIGYYTRLMLDAGASSVIAFEPNPFNFVFLEQNCRFVGDNRAHLHQHAISDFHGYIDLALSPVNSGDDTIYPFDDYERVRINTFVTAIDMMDFWDDPEFVKIDTQGSELKVLKGMTKLLSKNTPLTMAIEYYPDALRAAGDNPVDMLLMLWKNGFTVYEIKEGADGRLEKVEGLEICDREDLVRGYTNFWAVREE